MKKLITVLAVIGALAFASSALADEMTVLATPGLIRVTADFNLTAIDCGDHLELNISARLADSTVIFARSVGARDGNFAHSEKEPGVFSLDVSTRSCLLEFTLRLHDSDMQFVRGETISASASLENITDDEPVFNRTVVVEITGKLSTDL